MEHHSRTCNTRGARKGTSIAKHGDARAPDASSFLPQKQGDPSPPRIPRRPVVSKGGNTNSTTHDKQTRIKPLTFHSYHHSHHYHNSRHQRHGCHILCHVRRRHYCRFFYHQRFSRCNNNPKETTSSLSSAPAPAVAIAGSWRLGSDLYEQPSLSDVSSPPCLPALPPASKHDEGDHDGEDDEGAEQWHANGEQQQQEHTTGVMAHEYRGKGANEEVWREAPPSGQHCTPTTTTNAVTSTTNAPIISTHLGRSCTRLVFESNCIFTDDQSKSLFKFQGLNHHDHHEGHLTHPAPLLLVGGTTITTMPPSSTTISSSMTALLTTPAPTTNATENVEREGEDKAFAHGDETQSLPDDHNDGQKHNSPERREMRGNREQQEDDQRDRDGEMDQGSVHSPRSEQPRSGLRFCQQQPSPLDSITATSSATAETMTTATTAFVTQNNPSNHQLSILHSRSDRRSESSPSSLSTPSDDERSEDEIVPSDLPNQENNQDRWQSQTGVPHLAKPFQECAICLDAILPRQHATAVLACQHIYHLSCISVAFKCRNEMICPLCRHLHKNQPFQLQGDTAGSSDPPTRSSFPDATSLRGGPGAIRSYRETFSSGSNRSGFSPNNVNGDILGGGDRMVLSPGTHLQQHLRNLMQHQRRNYLQELATHEHPTSGTVLSMVPSFFGDSMMTTGGVAGGGGTPGTMDGLSGLYLSTTTWLMVYGIPFAAAVSLLIGLLAQGVAGTQYSTMVILWCIVGSVLCYMTVWSMVVAFLHPDQELRRNYLAWRQRRQQEQAILSESSLMPGAVHPAALAAAAAAATTVSTARDSVELPLTSPDGQGTY